MGPDGMPRIGIDLGGTKIEIVALADDGHELLRRRVPTPQGDYAATLAAIAGLLAAAEAELGQRAPVGIGIPGSESPTDALGCIRNANSTCLNGRPLRQDLQQLLQRDVRLENDANCLALSESVDGAGAGAAVVFAAILGTGVGGGVVVDGKVLAGANRIAGEWGHNPLPYAEEERLPPPRCYCGRQGCIETWLCGPGLAADHQRHGGSGETPEEIVAAAAAGNPKCEETLRRYERRLAKALAGVINLLDPQVIVLGGGLSRIERFYRTVPDLWGAYVFSDIVRTRLLPSRYGDSSGVRGAARLWETS